jgi:hypothetical protein
VCATILDARVDRPNRIRAVENAGRQRSRHSSTPCRLMERLDSHETIGTAILVGGSGNERGAHDVESRQSWGAQELATHVQSSNSSAASRLALPPAAEVLMVIVCSEAKRMR